MNGQETVMVQSFPVVANVKRRYVLTNGLDAFEMRRMDALELRAAQCSAFENAAGIWWDSCD